MRLWHKFICTLGFHDWHPLFEHPMLLRTTKDWLYMGYPIRPNHPYCKRCGLLINEERLCKR